MKKINLFSKSKSSKQSNVNDIETVSKSDIDNYVSKELNKTKTKPIRHLSGGSFL